MSEVGTFQLATNGDQELSLTAGPLIISISRYRAVSGRILAGNRGSNWGVNVTTSAVRAGVSPRAFDVFAWQLRSDGLGGLRICAWMRSRVRTAC
jgi:hypothetical protein